MMETDALERAVELFLTGKVMVLGGDGWLLCVRVRVQ